METINITSDELKNLIIYSKGFESILYRSDEVLYKIYHNIDEKTLEKIAYFNRLNLEFTTNPSNYLKVNGKYQGFSMNLKRGFYPLIVFKNLDIEKKIEILLKIKKYLHELKLLGIVYGDLNINNIVTDGDEVYLTDIINCKTERHDFNVISATMNKYKSKNGEMDYKLDNYMFNLLTIYFLNDIEYSEILNEIERAIDDYFNNKNHKEIIGLTDNINTLSLASEMLNPEKGIDDLLIDHIDLDKYKTKMIK